MKLSDDAEEKISSYFRREKAQHWPALMTRKKDISVEAAESLTAPDAEVLI